MGTPGRDGGRRGGDAHGAPPFNRRSRLTVAAQYGRKSRGKQERGAHPSAKHAILREKAVAKCGWQVMDLMAQNTMAPWAELVPNTGPMTIDQLLALPQDQWMYELVDGGSSACPPVGERHLTSRCVWRRRWSHSPRTAGWARDRSRWRIRSDRTGRDGRDGARAHVAFVRAEHVPAQISPHTSAPGVWRGHRRGIRPAAPISP